MPGFFQEHLRPLAGSTGLHVVLLALLAGAALHWRSEQPPVELAIEGLRDGAAAGAGRRPSPAPRRPRRRRSPSRRRPARSARRARGRAAAGASCRGSGGRRARSPGGARATPGRGRAAQQREATNARAKRPRPSKLVRDEAERKRTRGREAKRKAAEEEARSKAEAAEAQRKAAEQAQAEREATARAEREAELAAQPGRRGGGRRARPLRRDGRVSRAAGADDRAQLDPAALGACRPRVHAVRDAGAGRHRHRRASSGPAMATRPCASRSRMPCSGPRRCRPRAIRGRSSGVSKSCSSRRSSDVMQMRFRGTRRIAGSAGDCSRLALLLAASPSQAQLRLDITQGVRDAVPIAVVPFGGQAEGAATDVAAVIANDLQMSGRFAPLERRDLVARPTRGAEIRFEDWRLLQVRFHRRRPRRARGLRAGRGLRALQRAHRRLAARAAAAVDGARPARHGAPHRRPRVRAAHGHSRRILDPHCLRHGGRPPAQPALPAGRRRRRRLQPAHDHRVDRADHVAGVVAGRTAASRTCRSRARSRRSTCSDSRSGRATPRVGPRRHQRRAGVVAGRPAARTDAVAGRQSRHLHAGTRDAEPDARHQRRGDRHGAGVGARRPEPVLHVGPRRQRAGLPGRARRCSAKSTASRSRTATTPGRACRPTARNSRW